MRRFRVFQLAVAFLLSAGWIAADPCTVCCIGDSCFTPQQGDFAVSLDDSNPLDPRISIGDGCCSHQVGDSFALESSPGGPGVGGGGVFNLMNISGGTFSNLNFFADFGHEINVEDFNCDPGPFFGGCTPTVNGNTVNILFFGGSGIPSAPDPLFPPTPITPDQNGVGGWLDGQGNPLILSVNANVPEPSTFVLLLSVAGVVAARRRLSKSRS